MTGKKAEKKSLLSLSLYFIRVTQMLSIDKETKKIAKNLPCPQTFM